MVKTTEIGRRVLISGWPRDQSDIMISCQKIVAMKDTLIVERDARLEKKANLQVESKIINTFVFFSIKIERELKRACRGRLHSKVNS